VNLIRTGLLNAIAVAIRMLSAIVLNKVLAIYVGPAGYALIGQFQNLVSMLTTFASGAVNTGVTKGTAQHFDDPERQVRIWRTAGTIATVGAGTIGLLLACFHTQFARQFLGDERFGRVFVWLGASLVFIALNGLLLAILNGKKQIGLFVLINIAGSLIGLAVTGGLSVLFGLEGALMALSVNQAMVFVVSATLCARQPWFRFSMLYGRIDRAALRDLLKFTAMALTSAAMVPLVQILIRNHLMLEFGHESAGYWEALMRISGLYLTIVTVPLSVYYLPRLAEIRQIDELKREVLSGYRIIVPVTMLGGASIFLLRDFITLTLFTPEFLPMRDLFGWQMIGDVLKICSWLLGYVLIGRGMMLPYIISEVIFGVMWYLLVLVFTLAFGLQGAQMAYAATYGLYFPSLAFLLLLRVKRLSFQNEINKADRGNHGIKTNAQ
jgi:polysaccharide transporter, PST family